MKYVRPTPAPKGSLKCFHCRESVRPANGNWYERSSRQVFLCKTCEHLPAERVSSPTPTLPTK